MLLEIFNGRVKEQSKKKVYYILRKVYYIVRLKDWINV